MAFVSAVNGAVKANWPVEDASGSRFCLDVVEHRYGARWCEQHVPASASKIRVGMRVKVRG